MTTIEREQMTKKSKSGKTKKINYEHPSTWLEVKIKKWSSLPPEIGDYAFSAKTEIS